MRGENSRYPDPEKNLNLRLRDSTAPRAGQKPGRQPGAHELTGGTGGRSRQGPAPREIKLDYRPQPKQNLFHSATADIVLWGGSAGPGKVLAKDGVVVTPFGFKKGRDLKIGQAINAPDGTIARIIQIRPDVKLEAWTVFFHDGTKTTVAADHLWLAWRSGEIKKKSNVKVHGEPGSEVIETRELKEWLDRALNQKACGIRPNWPVIPVCHEQPFNVQSRWGLRVEPYLLGVLLGDGSIADYGISLHSHIDDDAHFRKELSAYSFSVSMSRGKGVAYRFRGESFKNLRDGMRRIKVLGTHSWDKFIPREYKLGSIETRYAIIQGLLDTDGYASDDGVFYTTVSKQLADDVAFIIQSLGGTATITSKIPTYPSRGEKKFGRRAYTLYIKHRNACKLFRLERKRVLVDCWDPPMYRRVVKIEVGGEIEGNCITVSHPSGLYMTNDFIVTHNSTGLLMDALIFALEHPGTTAMLMRRTYPELESSLIKKSLEMFPREICRYNSAKHQWTLATGAKNSYVTFGHCERVDDVYKHRSAEWQYLGIDESTSFSQEIFEQLYVRVRSSTPGVKCKVRLCSNPGLLGHGWHKKFFGIGDHKPFEVWRPEKKAGDKYDPPTRVFIPATIFDNPALLNNDPGYLARLEALPEAQKRMLLYGDWEGFTGQYFTEFDRAKHVIKPVAIPRHWKLYRSVDFGYDKPFSCHWHAVAENGHCFTYREVYKRGLRDKEQAELIKRASVRLDGSQGVSSESEVFEFTVGDPSQVVKSKDSGISTQHVYHEAGIPIFPGSNARVPGWNSMRNWLAIDPATGTPWWQIFDTCPELVREIEEAVFDPNKPEDLDTRGSDHAIDECRYFMMARPAPASSLKPLNPNSRLDQGSRAEWAAVAKMQNDTASDALRRQAILYGLNE